MRGLLFVLLISVSGFALSIGGTIEEKVGEEIYLSGKTEKNIAYMGGGSAEAPTSLFPCKNCHGIRAEGLTEGGVSAPNIRWDQLSIQYRAKNITYNRDLFKRALLNGVDASGRKISSVMPRYVLNDNEIDNLKTYLHKLERPQVKGVSDESIKLAVVLPENRLQAEVIRQTLSAYFDQLNMNGGVFHRHIDLDFMLNFESSSDAFFILNINTDEFGRLSPASLSSGSLFSGKDNIISVFERRSGVGRFNMYSRQYNSQVLKQFANQYDYDLVEFDNLDQTELNKFVNKSMNKLTARIAILYQGSKPQTLVTLLGEQGGYPLLMLTREVAGIGDVYPGAVVAVVPPIPDHVEAEGQTAYLRLSKVYSLPKPYLAQQLWVLATAEVLTEGLRQSGHGLHIDKLMAALESFYQYQPHYGPDITFVANQRTGALGGVVIDLSSTESRFSPLWIEM